MKTLKKCSCGGEGKLVGHHVQCKSCGKRTGVWMEETDAIKEWNAGKAKIPEPFKIKDIIK